MDNFISKWLVDNDDLSVTLPLISGGYFKFNVDWGDSLTDLITSFDDNLHIHTYASAGTYTIELCGVCQGFNFSRVLSSEALKLIEINNFGNIEILDAYSAFQGCHNLQYLALDAPVLSGDSTLISSPLKTLFPYLVDNPYFITNVGSMFRDCMNIDTAVGLTGLNTSNVQIFDNMFEASSAFNQNISAWDMSSALSIEGMFSRATSFNQPINNWNVSNVITMGGLFNKAENFNQALNNWDVGNVVNMSRLFNDAKTFNQSINTWNVSAVTDMSGMFYGCSVFNQPLNIWGTKTNSLTSTESMFELAINFNQELNSWDVSNIQSMQSMFENAASFNQPLDNWDVGSVIDMSRLFRSASGFNQNLTSWGTKTNNVQDMSYMFNNCIVFNYPLNNWNVSNVLNMESMFDGATTFNQDLNLWDVNNVTNMVNMFKDSGFDSDVTNWSFRSLTAADGMFLNISIVNYDNLLFNLATDINNLQSDVVFDAGESRYSHSAEAYKQQLIDNKNWDIFDGGFLYVPPVDILIKWECNSNCSTLEGRGVGPRSSSNWLGKWVNLSNFRYPAEAEFTDPLGVVSPYQPKSHPEPLTFTYESSGIHPEDLNSLFHASTALEARAVIQPFSFWSATNFDVEPQLKIRAKDFTDLQTALTDISGKLVCTQFESACFDYGVDRCNSVCGINRTITGNGTVYTAWCTSCRGGYTSP